MGITFTGAGIFGTISVVVDESVGAAVDHHVDGEIVVDHHVLDSSVDDCNQEGVGVVD